MTPTTVTLEDTGETVTIPDGYQPLVWELRSSLRGVVPSSRLHLAPVDQGTRPFLAACGARRPAGRGVDRPEYAPGPCKRCQAKTRPSA